MAENAATVYSGQDFSPRGEKGRYVLPTEFRKAVIESSGGKVLCLAKHERWKCLTAFGLSREHELNAQLLHEEERAIRLTRDFDVDLRRIQLRAYQIWEGAGRPSGQDKAHWEQASQEFPLVRRQFIGHRTPRLTARRPSRSASTEAARD